MSTILLLTLMQWLCDLLQWHWAQPCLVWAIAWGWSRGPWRQRVPQLLAVGLLADLLHWGALGSRLLPLVGTALLMRYLATTLHVRQILAHILLSTVVIGAVATAHGLWRGVAWTPFLWSHALLHAALGVALLHIQMRYVVRRPA